MNEGMINSPSISQVIKTMQIVEDDKRKVPPVSIAESEVWIDQFPDEKIERRADPKCHCKR
jgi:hypothetical protein